MVKRYSPEELGIIIEEAEKETPLSDLVKKLEMEFETRRSGLAVIEKLWKISQTNQELYERYQEYWRQYYKENREEMLERDRCMCLSNEYKEQKRQYGRERRKKKPYKKFGDFLVERLKGLGKNQSQIAQEVGVSRQIVSIWKIGVSIPKTKYWPSLANSLRVNYEELKDFLVELKFLTSEDLLK